MNKKKILFFATFVPICYFGRIQAWKSTNQKVHLFKINTYIYRNIAHIYILSIRKSEINFIKPVLWLSVKMQTKIKIFIFL